MWKIFTKRNRMVEMADVKKCDVQNCGYNVGKSCHAKAITIGDSQNPGCDTFLDAQRHTRETIRIAGVGACKVSSCQFNDDFECTAKNIAVGDKNGKVNCLTYAPR